MAAFLAKVLTVSDGVAEGVREDKSGRALVARLLAADAEVVEHRITADGVDAVAAALRDLSDGFAGLIITTGGTGFGPRDLTPEGTAAVIERSAPGLAEAIRRVSDADDRGLRNAVPGRLWVSRGRADLQRAGLRERRGRGARCRAARRRPRARPARRRASALVAWPIVTAGAGPTTTGASAPIGQDGARGRIRSAGARERGTVISGQIGGWVKAAIVRLGRWSGERGQARLRSALGYLEIGSLLEELAGPDEVRRLRERDDVFELAIRRIAGTRPLYLEFGVYEGATLRWWSEHLRQPDAQLIGFDSFVGLPERWRPGFEAGAFETAGPPEIADPRVSLVAGWFEDTLARFKPPENDQLIVNVDCDLFSSAATVLRWVEPYLVPGTMLYFDELSDRDHELRALRELVARSGIPLVPVAMAGGGTHLLFEVAG